MSTDPRNPVAVKPVVVALLTADGIHRDPTGKYYLLGVFDVIRSRQFPVTHCPFGVYLALTEGYGATSIALRLVEARNDNEVRWQASIEVKFKSPIEAVEIGLPVPAITFPRRGEYLLQVVCSGEVLFERQIIVRPTTDSRKP